MQHKTGRYFKKHHGFTLLELAIVIMISGFSMLAIAQFMKIYTVNLKHEKTIDHLRMTQDAIDEFFGLNGRYPCPANPTLLPGDPQYGLQQCRSDADLIANPDNCTGKRAGLFCPDPPTFSRDGDENGALDVVMIGIVPFRTLFGGVVETRYLENYRLDGYSTYIAYAVTEHMTDRTRFGIVNQANPTTGGIRVTDENQISLTIPDNSAHYVVFSHGENRRAGYSSSGVQIGNCFVSIISGIPPTLSPPAPAPIGPSAAGSGIDVEIENCDNNDAIFVKGIMSVANNDSYNDDILFFKSKGLTSLWKNSLSPNVPVGQSYIYNTNLGYVGVGTTNPAKDFHIVGDLDVQNSAMSNSYCDGMSTDCLLPSAIGGIGYKCPNSNEVAYAIQNNELVCRKIDWVMPERNCSVGEYLVGFSNLGHIRCAPI